MKIHKVIGKLSEHRPIFHSEADFQYAMAQVIQKMYPEAKVRLEYPIRLLTMNPKDNRALDIWIQNKKIAIELKYANKHLECTCNGENC